MRFIIITILAAVLVSTTSFTKVNKKSGKTLMVITNTLNESVFSVFYIQSVNGILVGTNTEKYPVNCGIYRIDGSSNDEFYHKRIVIN